MKHMNREDRETIENMLKSNATFTEISEQIGYHRTSISSEIIKHRIQGKIKTYGSQFVNCKYEDTCELYESIGCKSKCEKFKLKECTIIIKPPYVCNGCKKKSKCRFQKYYYYAKNAQEMYEYDLKESRSGITIPEEIINKINEEIAPLIRDKNQTVNQVYLNHPDILYFSKSEFYKLIDLGLVEIKNIDLPRKVSYKKRKENSKIRITRKETKIRKNRTYKDYKRFINQNPDVDTIEVDTVEGEKGGKVLITITSRKHKFILIFLMESQTSEQTSKIFNWIKSTIGKEKYIKIFKCILTDNGKEFYEPEIMEQYNGKKVCNVFYCDGGKPYQKGCCEENHHYIRYYLPKKYCTFDNLNQEDCNKIMSHINSVPREILKGKTPYESILDDIEEKDLKKLGVERIKKDDVDLSSKILNGKGKRK